MTDEAELAALATVAKQARLGREELAAGSPALGGQLERLRELWADPEDLDKIPDSDPLAERLSYEGPIRFDPQGFPINPRGRTGIRGRGLLGKWGPNQTADPIVTRFHPVTGQLQMVDLANLRAGMYLLHRYAGSAYGNRYLRRRPEP